TEEITGLDIVEQQISIANGRKLNINQDALEMKGHAIEARIYAEDPVTFFPSPGHIDTFTIPLGENIRNETSVTNNYDVTPFYDPMIAKLIVKGKTRNEAIFLIEDALQAYCVDGIKTNIPMLIKIVGSKQYKAGNTTTSFVDKYYLPAVKNYLGGIRMKEMKESMAGSVWKIIVRVGAEVEEDQDTVILESMKMEIPRPAEEKGTVKVLKVSEGDFVNEGDLIAIIE